MEGGEEEGMKVQKVKGREKTRKEGNKVVKEGTTKDGGKRERKEAGKEEEKGVEERKN